MKTEPVTEYSQFDYNPKWSLLILLAAMFGGAAAFFAYKANSNEFGLVINGIVHLSKNGANIFYWSLSGFSVLIVIGAALLGGNKQFTEFCEVLFARLKRAQSIDT